MQFTIEPKGKDKTTHLILRCSAENKKEDNLTYIVCPNKERVRAVFEMAQKLQAAIPYPMTMDELFGYRTYISSYVKNILIDDIDVWLRSKTWFNILEVTATKEEEDN